MLFEIVSYAPDASGEYFNDDLTNERITLRSIRFRDPAPRLRELRKNLPEKGRAMLAESDEFEFLAVYHTIILVNDDRSMTGPSWEETIKTMGEVVEIISALDPNGLDLFFVNNRERSALNVTTAEQVSQIFHKMQPVAGDPISVALNRILRPYLIAITQNEKAHRPLNIIVLTKNLGTSQKQLHDLVLRTARRLDRSVSRLNQICITFFQVGSDPVTLKQLEQLEEVTAAPADIRSMCFGFPSSGPMEGRDMLSKVRECYNESGSYGPPRLGRYIHVYKHNSTWEPILGDDFEGVRFRPREDQSNSLGS